MRSKAPAVPRRLSALSLQHLHRRPSKIVSLMVALLFAAGVASPLQMFAACLLPPTGLVAWWNGQSDATDSRAKVVGTLKGGTTTTPAKVGRGFLFNGTSGFVEIPDHFNLDQPDFVFPWTFSAEAWIRLDSLARFASSSSTIVSQAFEANNNSSAWRWFVSSTGTLDFEIRDRVGPGAVRHVRTTDPVIQPGTGVFRHVAVTMDLDQQSIRIYVDGAEMPTTLVESSVIPRWVPSTASVRIGVFLNSNFFHGAVDELSLYNTVLTPSQIAGIYAADSEGKCTGPTQLASPDLSVAGFWAYAWQGQPSALQNMTATWRVDNLGKTLGASGAMNRLTLSRDREQRQVIQQWENPSPFPVLSGTSYQVNIPFEIPALPAGDYFLRAESFPSSPQSPDGNLADNALVLPLYIGLVDLMPTNLLFTVETGEQGLSWNIQWEIKNLGDTPYIRSNFDQVDEWVLSTSPDPADRIQSWPSFREFETLGPGQTVRMPVMRILPPNLPLGNYYLIINLRSHLDLNRQNDTAAIPVFLPTLDLPDLQISRLGRDGVVGSFEAVAGETVAVTWQVDNIGKGRALGIWLDRFTLSKGRTTDPTLVVAGGVVPSVSRSLFPKANYQDLSYLVIPPDLDPGVYYLIAEVDFPGEVAETDKRNNSLTIPVRINPPNRPDLAVSDLRWNGVPSPGQLLEVRFRVTNLGPSSNNASSTWTDSVAISAFPDGRSPMASWSVSSFHALPRLSSDEVIVKDWRLPVNLTGAYYLVASTRSQSVVEVSERNNTQILPMFVEKPDLVVTQLAWSGKAQAGEDLTVSWRVQNVGKGFVSGYWPDRLILSYSPSVTDAFQSWDFYATNSATPGAGYDILPRRVRLPGLPPGTYYMIAMADAFSLWSESSETNNIQVLPITLGGTDLAAAQLHAVAPSVAAGQDLDISWIVRNDRTNGYSGFWTDRVLLFPNPSTSEPIGSWEFYRHRTASTSTGYTESQTIRLPAAVPGNYSLVVRVDSLNNVTESDEANNELVIPLTLTNLPPAVTFHPPVVGPSLLSCLPPSILLTATLEPGSYAVERVDYYDGDVPIGTALGTVSGARARSSVLTHGQHLLTARAVDALGLVVTSAPVSLKIDRPPLNYLHAETSPDGSIVCCMGAEPGVTYVVESNVGPVNNRGWHSQSTNSPIDSLLIFTNQPERLQQLFRIRTAP